MATFTIYSYMFSPITDASEGELFPDTRPVSPSGSYDRRQEHLHSFFEGKKKFTFQSEGVEYHSMLLLNRDRVLVMRIANNKIWHHEQDFEIENFPDQPSLVVIVDNRRDGQQKIAVQCKTKAFVTTGKVAQIMQNAFNEHLRRFRLRVSISPKYSTARFWQLIDKHPSGIVKVDFHFPYPNMPEISDMVRDIEDIARRTNSEPSLTLKGQNRETLKLDKEDLFIVNAIKACAASGRPILIKPKGKRQVQIGVLHDVRETLSDTVLEHLDDADLFDSRFSLVLEFLKGIKLVYDD